MLTRISLLMVAVALFGSIAAVEAGKPSNKSQPVTKKTGNGNGGNNQGNNNNKNSIGRQIGRQLLNQYVFGNGYGNRGPYGNGGWNNGNGGNWNNGNCRPHCPPPCNNGGPVVLPAGEEPPVVEEPAADQPVDPNTPEGQPIDPMGPPTGEEGTDVTTEEGTPEGLETAGVPGALKKGADLQAKLVAFSMMSTIPTARTLTANKALTLSTNKPRRVVYAEIACVGNLPYAGGRTLTIEHDSNPGLQPPTIIAVAKIPAIAAGQVYKFQKELPAGYSLESLRLRMTLSGGDANAANDMITSRE